jgi:hypothetical protein
MVDRKKGIEEQDRGMAARDVGARCRVQVVRVETPWRRRRRRAQAEAPTGEGVSVGQPKGPWIAWKKGDT